MKTNIEQHIKSQLSERNLNPSENSWDKLSQMMGEEKTEKKTVRFPKWWTFAVAASVIVFVSVVIVNSFEKGTANIQIVDTEISIPEKPASVEPNKTNDLSPENNPAGEIAVHSEKKQISQKPEIINPKEKTQIKSETPIKTSITRPENTDNDLLASFSNDSEPKVIENKYPEEVLVAQTKEPETKTEKKKASYVDSNMLLYSVENNQAISETNGNSRLVIIDFNK